MDDYRIIGEAQKMSQQKQCLIIRLIIEVVQIECPTRMNNIFSVHCDNNFTPVPIMTLNIAHLVFSE